MTDENPKAEGPRYHPPSAQAMVDAAREANEQWPKEPKGAYGVELQTKSGTKRIRVRRCTRTLRLSNDLMVHCQLEQHDADKQPMHEHKLNIFTPDGHASGAVIHWRELGPVAPLILMKVTKQ